MKRFLTPPSILVITVFLSFFFWLVGNTGITGIGVYKKFPIFSNGFLLVIAWYIIAFLATYMGYIIGKSFNLKMPIVKKSLLSNNDLYAITTLCATIGIAASFAKVFQTISFQQMLDLISSGQANLMKEALYKDYAPGVYTLRYLTITSATLAFYRRFILKIKSPLDFLNILLLILTSILSSRLSIIMTLISTAYLTFVHRGVKIKFWYGLIGFFLIFNLMAFLNYSRNKNFYSKYDIGYYGGLFAQASAYLGSPFQGSLSVGENYDLIRLEPYNYYKYASISKFLMTNSGFLFMYIDYDFYAFIVMPLMLFFWAFIFGWFTNYKNTYLQLSNAAILYAFAEFWRLNWFGEGIMLTLFFFPIAIIFLGFLIEKLKFWN